MRNRNSKIMRICLDGMFLAIALIMGYVEATFPINIGIPGFKPGLANVVTIIILFIIGTGDAFIVGFLRVLMIGILFTNASMMIFGIAGFVLSFIVMFLIKHVKAVGVIGISVLGAISHNIAQLFTAAFMYMGKEIIGIYLPVLIVLGVITGIFTGAIAYYTIRPFGNIKKKFIIS